MDKRFFELVFTPFFSCVMQGTECRGGWDNAIINMANRLKAMPDKIRLELIAGLKAEIIATQAKLPRIDKDLQLDFKLKIEAIKKLLQKA